MNGMAAMLCLVRIAVGSLSGNLLLWLILPCSCSRRLLLGRGSPNAVCCCLAWTLRSMGWSACKKN